MRKILFGLAALVAIGATLNLIQGQPSIPPPDVNKICGPALTRQLDDVVYKELYRVVHASWKIEGQTMTIDTIFAQGNQSHYVIAQCKVVQGKPVLQALEDKKPD